MKKFTDFEQVLVDKIHYHAVDVPCCFTCSHSKPFEHGMVICGINRYDNPEIGEITEWFGDYLGVCDNYEKKA
jgi:hypothetical protein